MILYKQIHIKKENGYRSTSTFYLFDIEGKEIEAMIGSLKFPNLKSIKKWITSKTGIVDFEVKKIGSKTIHF